MERSRATDSGCVRRENITYSLWYLHDIDISEQAIKKAHQEARRHDLHSVIFAILDPEPESFGSSVPSILPLPNRVQANTKAKHTSRYWLNVTTNIDSRQHPNEALYLSSILSLVTKLANLMVLHV
jgi:hypothetical protein